MTEKSVITQEIFLKKIQDEFTRFIPLNIPIKREGIKLGTVKIDFEINKKAKIPKKQVGEYEHFFNQLLLELRLLETHIERDVILSINTNMLMDSKIKVFYSLLNIFHSDEICPISLMFLIDKEDDIFRFISKEGPRALRNERIQFLLSGWLSDDESAKGKIDKLSDALMKYSYGEDHNDRRFPDGRPPIEFLNKLGYDWIMNMLVELTVLFREVKFLSKKTQNDTSNDFKATQLINSAYEKYLLARKLALQFSKAPENLLKSKLFSKVENKKYTEKLMINMKSLKELSPDFLDQKEHEFALLEKKELLKIIIDCINNNEKLENLYKSFIWEPHKFAKEIIANMLGISVSTIEKIKKFYSPSQITD